LADSRIKDRSEYLPGVSGYTTLVSAQETSYRAGGAEAFCGTFAAPARGYLPKMRLCQVKSQQTSQQPHPGACTARLIPTVKDAMIPDQPGFIA